MDNAEYITMATVNNDLAIVGTSFALETNREALREKLQQGLKLQLGASIYDLTAGFDWEKLHGSINPVHYNTRMRRWLEAQPFVQKVLNISINFLTAERIAQISFEIETPLGAPVAVTFDTVV